MTRYGCIGCEFNEGTQGNPVCFDPEDWVDENGDDVCRYRQDARPKMYQKQLDAERAKVKLLVKRIRGALMHLNINFDSDFVSMADSVAADELRKALRECGEGGE